MGTCGAAVASDAQADILQALIQARASTERVGLLTYGQTIPELESVKTLLNIEVLQQAGSLPPGEHDALLRDVVQQTDELTALVTDIVHAGENTNMPEEVQDVRLDDLVEASIERTRRLSPGITVTQDLSETVVDGVPERLARLVANLLDNAVKWTPADRPIEVRLHDRTLTVRDHGPGFATDDLPHVFDRFYRSPAARGMPGSGLGLSIVRQVADLHGASVLSEGRSRRTRGAAGAEHKHAAPVGLLNLGGDRSGDRRPIGRITNQATILGEDHRVD